MERPAEYAAKRTGWVRRLSLFRLSKEAFSLAKAVRDFADELDAVITKLKAGNLQALSTVPTLKGLQEIQTASTAIANKGYKIGG